MLGRMKRRQRRPASLVCSPPACPAPPVPPRQVTQRPVLRGICPPAGPPLRLPACCNLVARLHGPCRQPGSSLQAERTMSGTEWWRGVTGESRHSPAARRRPLRLPPTPPHPPARGSCFTIRCRCPSSPVRRMQSRAWPGSKDSGYQAAHRSTAFLPLSPTSSLPVSRSSRPTCVPFPFSHQ